MIKSIVFFIQNMSRPAGSERVTSLIANELVKRGYQISILSICGDNTSFYPLDKSIQLDTIIDKEDVNNRKEFFSVLCGLQRYYKIHNTDLVIDIFASLSIYTILLKIFYGYKNKITWEEIQNPYIPQGMIAEIENQKAMQQIYRDTMHGVNNSNFAVVKLPNYSTCTISKKIA